jgi:molecular chaperone DnaK (HSP70)
MFRAAGTLPLTPIPPNDLLIVGFDFGTGSSRTTAKHVYGDHTRENAVIRHIRLKPDQDFAMRQIMNLLEDGNVVYGNVDVNKAVQRKPSLRARTMRRIKLSLHPGFEGLPDVIHTLKTIFAEKDRAARQDLFEDFLRALFNDVRAAHKRRPLKAGQPDSYWDAIPLEIHISVPAMWNDEQRGIIRNAAQRAAKACGISCKDPKIDLREEALCVATYFLSKDRSAQVGSIHIFVDVGDGTLDITTVIVVRAHSLSGPMQLQRLGLCSGSDAGSHKVNAGAEAWVIRKFGELEVDKKCRQLDITRHEFSRQLWQEVDKLKRDIDSKDSGDLHWARISGSHGRMGPGLLNEWTIDFPIEAITEWFDDWTSAADQLLQQHLATLSPEQRTSDISATLTGVSLPMPFPSSQ